MKKIFSNLLPQSVKRSINEILRLNRILTSSRRMLPSFIIMGGQRCGTTSLYSYLMEHPNIVPPITKELHFFDNNFKKGLRWYRSRFPKVPKNQINHNTISGESSPYYIFHPHVPKRISKTLPEVKLIAMLRNPIHRAYSHHQWNIRNGLESLSFDDAVKLESDRLSGEKEKMIIDENYHSHNYQHYSYLSRGIYVDQIKTWRNLFPNNQILILKSEDFYDYPKKSLTKVFDFLELVNYNLKEYRKYNLNKYQQMPNHTRKSLSDFFEPHNQRLYDYLGVDYQWA